jgi:hypothetical protein
MVKKLKFYKIAILLIVFFMEDVKSQEVNKHLPFVNYKITNQILLEELEDYVKYYEWKYRKEEKAISVFVSINKDTTMYTINYELDYYYMLQKYYPNTKFFNHPDLISEYKGNYVFFRFEGFFDTIIREDVMDKIIKDRYLDVYKRFENGEFVLGNNYHHIPTVELTVKNDTLIHKEFYEN